VEGKSVLLCTIEWGLPLMAEALIVSGSKIQSFEYGTNFFYRLQNRLTTCHAIGKDGQSQPRDGEVHPNKDTRSTEHSHLKKQKITVSGGN